MTSATAPGVTHRWTNVWAYADEVAMARIYAGFHYRFSTRVGQDMGRKIGRLAVQNLMQPALAEARYSRSPIAASREAGPRQRRPALELVRASIVWISGTAAEIWQEKP